MMPTPSFSHKAVHQWDGKWWFWGSESDAYERNGPYPSYAIAAAAMWCSEHKKETGELYMVIRVDEEVARVIEEAKDTHPGDKPVITVKDDEE